MALCCFQYVLVQCMNTTVCFYCFLGLVFMGRRKCEAVACLSSQMKCNFMNFYIVYFMAHKFDLKFDLITVKQTSLSWQLIFSARLVCYLDSNFNIGRKWSKPIIIKQLVPRLECSGLRRVAIISSARFSWSLSSTLHTTFHVTNVVPVIGIERTWRGLSFD